ncbi:MAG: T9SS type A sorting domain-containing protein [Saprospiraceae bacterium]
MFGIQAVCHNPLPSGVDIIIQDKVVLKIKYNDGIGCGCEAYESTEVLGDQWPYIAPDAEFDLRIVSNGSDNNLATLHGKRIGDDIHFNLSCPSKLQIVEQNHVVFFYNYNDQYQGLLNFEPNWYFIPEWTVLFSTCKSGKVPPPTKRFAFDNNELQPSRIFPNPVSSHLWLENGNFKKGELVMKIFDPAGKLVQTIDSYVDGIETNKLGMEVGALHEGLYFLKVIQEGQISSFTFYKK